MSEKISVIIPTYNEEKTIESTVTKVIEYCEKNFDDYEIIVVDDSKDNSDKILSKYKKVVFLRNEKRMGKGYCVKMGLLMAKFPLVIFLDSDLSTPLSEIKKLVKFSQDFDVVIGSRKLNESKIKVKQNIKRRLAGMCFSFLVKLLAVKGFKDTQCGFKLFRNDAGKRIAKLQRINGFAFDVELLLIAKKLGFRIKEVPITWCDNKDSKVNLLKDSISMLKDLLRIKLNSLRGIYD